MSEPSETISWLPRSLSELAECKDSDIIYGRITTLFGDMEVYSSFIFNSNCKDPTHLVDPRFKIAFMFGTDSLKRISGCSAYEALLMLGKTSEYIEQQIKQNAKFKLVLVKCPEDIDGMLGTRADWKGIASLCKLVYPEFYPYYLKHLEEIQIW